MGFYKSVIRPLLFILDPESAHHFTFRVLRLIPISLINAFTRPIKSKTLHANVFGIDFPNRIGLAAGFDKDGKLFSELSALGFGFIEIGTVTPLPQPGNEKPRMFRLPSDQALINRMGFNNEGLESMISRLKKKNNKIIIGGNIGKNKITSNENAHLDYEKCFHALFPFVDYFVVNVSSPNTPGLRELQEKAPLLNLLSGLQKLNFELSGNSRFNAVKPKPILLKISPDLNNTQLDEIIEVVLSSGINGVIAANTTVSRENLKSSDVKNEPGGLSGKPLMTRSTEIISYLKIKSNGKFSIIGSGGIMSPEDAIEKINAGADLVQLYTGFIYEGPSLIRRINKALMRKEN